VIGLAAIRLIAESENPVKESMPTRSMRHVPNSLRRNLGFSAKKSRRT
jgi:hypothetical protein